MRCALILLAVLALEGCDNSTPSKQPLIAQTEDGRTIRAYHNYYEVCVDGFVAISSNHQSWWKLNQHTKQPIRCEVIK